MIERTPESLRAALGRLSGDPALQQCSRARSLAVAHEHFGLDRFVSAYEELYAEAINRSG